MRGSQTAKGVNCECSCPDGGDSCDTCSSSSSNNVTINKERYDIYANVAISYGEDTVNVYTLHSFECACPSRLSFRRGNANYGYINYATEHYDADSPTCKAEGASECPDYGHLYILSNESNTPCGARCSVERARYYNSCKISNKVHFLLLYIL